MVPADHPRAGRRHDLLRFHAGVPKFVLLVMQSGAGKTLSARRYFHHGSHFVRPRHHGPPGRRKDCPQTQRYRPVLRPGPVASPYGKALRTTVLRIRAVYRPADDAGNRLTMLRLIPVTDKTDREADFKHKTVQNLPETEKFRTVRPSCLQSFVSHGIPSRHARLPPAIEAICSPVTGARAFLSMPACYPFVSPLLSDSRITGMKIASKNLYNYDLL